MDALITACNTVIKCQEAVLLAAENAPASPGPNAKITQCKEATQTAVDGLVLAIEDSDYDLTTAAEQKAERDKVAADEKAKADADAKDAAAKAKAPEKKPAAV
jgi:hypothetical protein